MSVGNGAVPDAAGHYAAQRQFGEISLPVAAEEYQMSDPYAPQPQQPNQPYSGQPYYPQQQPQYPEQPGAQQYGQPYGGQSYGDPYAAPQQAYQQPAYGQPAYGQPAPAGYPPPQPPVKKRRTGLIVGVVVAVVALLACSGIAVLAIKLGSDNKTTSSGGTSKTDTTKSFKLTAPATIGTLKKSSDQSQAQKMSSALTNAGLENPFAAVYQDTKNETHRVVIWGGTGAIFNAGGEQKQLDGFFSSLGSQLDGTKPAAADPGPIGGKAECAKSGLSGLKVSVCAWVGTGALLGFIFNGVEPGAAATQMRAILPSIAIKG